jgi:transcriptional regulator of acetoin/glycerol metabolism
MKVIWKGDKITPLDLPHSIIRSIGSKGVSSGKTLEEIEFETLKKTLERCGGDTSSAAEILGIDRSTIYRKLRKYNIKP